MKKNGAICCLAMAMILSCAALFKVDYHLNPSYFPAYNPDIPAQISVTIPLNVTADRIFWMSDNELLLIKSGYTQRVKRNRQWDTVVVKDTLWRIDLAGNSVTMLSEQESQEKAEQVFALYSVKLKELTEKEQQREKVGNVVTGILSAGASIGTGVEEMIANVSTPDRSIQKSIRYIVSTKKSKEGGYYIDTYVYIDLKNEDDTKSLIFKGYNPFGRNAFLSPTGKYLLASSVLINLENGTRLELWDRNTIKHYSPSPDWRRMAFVIATTSGTRIDIVPFNI